MSLLEKYLEYLAAGDAEKMASLFSEDAVFYDEGPTKMGMDPITVTGREAIKTFFQQVFSAQGPVKPSNVNINGNAMRYDVKIGDLTILALGLMKEENGLIIDYRVTVNPSDG